MTAQLAGMPTGSPADAGGDPRSAGSGRQRRPLPFAAHVIALAGVLLVMLPLVDNGSIGNPDESAALAQATLANPSDDWRSPYWAVADDPTGRWLPLENSTLAGSDYLPYDKRPAYPAVLAPVLRAGGQRGVLAFQAAGTLFAAICIALITARFAPRSKVTALWLAGIASPLFFDSYQVIAHSLATAAAAACLLALVELVHGHRSGWTARLLVAAAWGGALVAGLLRTEALMFAAAAAAALAVHAEASRRRGDRWTRPLGAAVGLVAVGLAAHLGSARWAQHLLGADSAEPFRIVDRQNWFVSRALGIQRTLLTPDSPGSAIAGLVTVGVVALFVAAAVMLRRGGGPVPIRLAAIGAAALSVVRLWGNHGAIPGLLFAAPVLVCGLMLFRAGSDSRRIVRVLATTALVHLTLVALTQYRGGGSGEWGWRYGHLALPALIPLAAHGLDSARQRTDAVTASVLRSCWIIAGVAFAVLGLLVHHHDRATGASVEHAVERAAERFGDSTPVVMTSPAEGRYAWKRALDGRHLLVQEPAEVAPVLEGLLAEHDDVLIGAPDSATVVARLRDSGVRVELVEHVAGADWSLYLVR